MSSAFEPWRQQLLSALRARNRAEVAPFQGLVDALARARDRAAQLQHEQQQAGLRQPEGGASASPASAASAGGGGGSGGDADELRKKVYALQEELTELHRRKGENAQQVIDLSALVKKQEDDLNEQAKELLLRHDKLENLSRQVEKLKMDLSELEQTNQLIKDEYQTLQLTLTGTETKLLSVQKENQQLVDRVLQFKERDVARMNEENDTFLRIQAEKRKKQLEEAIKDQKVVIDEGTSAPTIGTEKLDAHICYSVRVPNRAYIQFEAHDGEVNAIKWSPHGSLLVTGGGDRKIRLWDISKGTQESKGVLSGSSGAIMSLEFDASGTFLAAASGDCACRVWNLDDMRVRHTITGHSAKTLAAKFMGDNRKLCTGSHDRTLKVWDLSTKACINTLFPPSMCNDLVCMDNYIVSGHVDKKVRFYDTRAGHSPTNEVVLDGKVTSLDLSLKGQHLLAASRDNTLNLIDFRNPRRENNICFRAEGFHIGQDWSRAVFSPDSEYVTAGSGDGGVYIWNVNAPLKPERVLKEHEHCIMSLAWQPAGNCLTSCDKGKRVVVWADI